MYCGDSVLCTMAWNRHESPRTWYSYQPGPVTNKQTKLTVFASKLRPCGSQGAVCVADKKPLRRPAAQKSPGAAQPNVVS